MALFLALLSYGDTCGIGIDTDPGAIPDPERLHQYFEESVAELERHALVRQAGAGADEEAADDDEEVVDDELDNVVDRKKTRSSSPGRGRCGGARRYRRATPPAARI